MTEAPLIYTAKGNLPIDSLEHKTSWTDDEFNTVFTESYYLGDELVKRSVHVMSKVGTVAAGVSSNLG